MAGVVALEQNEEQNIGGVGIAAKMAEFVDD